MSGWPVLLMVLLLSTCAKDIQISKPEHDFTIQIPMGGNAWVIGDENYSVKTTLFSEVGIRNWINENEKIRIFFYCAKTGNINIGLRVKTEKGTSQIKVTNENRVKVVPMHNSGWEDVWIDRMDVHHIGYQYIDLEGMGKEGSYFADISDFLIEGMDPQEVSYVKDEFYWGRRGPSVHLNYQLPDVATNVEWFYSEVRIPQGQDVIGSFFMANGFAEGYFGIQVNSAEERRILFSVWSLYSTDDPNEIPEAYRIKLLKRGDDVKTGEFGNEGSGGQSYKVYPWKAEVNYRFLIGAKPVDSTTTYSAYFFDPEQGKWSLIARFMRPKTKTYLKRLHSFLENFIPEQGIVSRRGWYGNQWYYASNAWHEVTEAKFTADNTARKNARLDYAGGSESQHFYLQNCGFTDLHTPIDARFTRKSTGIPPQVNLDALE